MGANTKIEWADHTFNPWVGCTKVSPACDHCYAESWAKRSGNAALWQGQRRRTTAANWQKPRKWNREAEASGKRARVFCASLADVFDNQVWDRHRHDLWHLIEQTPHLDWLLLTKRPQNISKMLPDPETGVKPWGAGWPNVWLGTTVENQREAERRIHHLFSVPAALRFLSCEPLLGALDLRRIDVPGYGFFDSLTPGYFIDGGPPRRGLDWIIVGGESGPKARPMHPDWARSLRDQCQDAGVPFHFKQWGAWAPGECIDGPQTRTEAGATWHAGGWLFDDITPKMGSELHRDDEPNVWRVGKKAAGRLLDGRTWDEMPEVAP